MSKTRRESVLLKFEPKTDGAKVKISLLLRKLVVGNFLGRNQKDPIKSRVIVEDINVDNFDDTMKRMEISTGFTVENVLSGRGKLFVEGTLDSIDAFAPVQIANSRKFWISGKAKTAEDSPSNVMHQATLLLGALQELDTRLEEGDPDTFYNLVSAITREATKAPEVARVAREELHEGDLLSTLELGPISHDQPSND